MSYDLYICVVEKSYLIKLNDKLVGKDKNIEEQWEEYYDELIDNSVCLYDYDPSIGKIFHYNFQDQIYEFCQMAKLKNIKEIKTALTLLESYEINKTIRGLENLQNFFTGFSFLDSENSRILANALIQITDTDNSKLISSYFNDEYVINYNLIYDSKGKYFDVLTFDPETKSIVAIYPNGKKVPVLDCKDYQEYYNMVFHYDGYKAYLASAIDKKGIPLPKKDQKRLRDIIGTVEHFRDTYSDIVEYLRNAKEPIFWFWDPQME